MLMSVLVLGYGPIAQEFVRKFKANKIYQSDTTGMTAVRIHVVQVQDNDNPKYTELITTHMMQDGSALRVLKDGTEFTELETPFGDDISWLLESDGHDTIVELEDGPTEWLEELLPKLARRGYHIYVTNKNLISNIKDDLEEAAAEGAIASGRRTSMSTHEPEDVIKSIEAKILELTPPGKVFDKKIDELAMSKEGEPCGTQDDIPWDKLTKE